MQLGYKRVILDYHFSDFHPDTLTNVDPKAYIATMKEASIESFLVYAKDHWGNVYHKTTMSPVHPNAPEDLFGTLLTEARAAGIKPYAYTTIMWDEYAARMNPEWRAKSATGMQLELAPPDGAGWRFLCINTGYREYFLKQIDELAKGYEFDTLFLDILQYSVPVLVCYCDACRKRWHDTYDEDMPEDMTLADRLRFIEYRDEFYAEFYEEVREVMKRNGKENCAITHNFGGKPDLPDYIAKETEPFGKDYVIPQIIIKETRNRSRGRETEIYFGRFNKFWDFTVKSKELLRWEAVNVFAHDMATTIIDQPLLDGSLDPISYEHIGFAYREAEAVLAHTKGSSPYAELGVYFGHDNYEATRYVGHDDFVGACKLLTETHMPFDIVSDFDSLEDLKKFEAIVLPQTPYISSRVKTMLTSYVEEGGIIITDYQAGMNAENGEKNGTDHFLVHVQRHFNGLEHFIRPAFDAGATYIRTGRMYRFESEEGDVVLGESVPAALVRNQWEWISHNTPPGLHPEGASVVIRKIGKGKILYFNSAIFAEYLKTNLRSLRRFIVECMRTAYTPQIRVHAPSIIDAIYQQKENDIIITLNACTLDRGAAASSMYYGTDTPNLMNINESFPIGGISIETTLPIVRASDINGSAIAVEKTEAGVSIPLPPVNGFTTIVLSK